MLENLKVENKKKAYHKDRPYKYGKFTFPEK